jgi:hypothetical protein
MDLYLINTDKNCMVRWEVPDPEVNIMLTIIATTMGGIPKHEYPEIGNQIRIYFNDEQVDRMIEKAESLGPNEGTGTFLREIKHLKIPPPDGYGLN